MGRFFETKPAEGKPISIKGLARALVLLEQAWERLIVLGGGKLLWASDGVTPVLVMGEAATAGLPKPWEVDKADKTGVRLARCWFMRGPLLIARGTLTWEGGSATGFKTLSAKIAVEDPFVALVAGGEGEAYYTETSQLDDYYLIPLYIIERNKTSENWRVVADLRDMPQMVAYV